MPKKQKGKSNLKSTKKSEIQKKKNLQIFLLPAIIVLTLIVFSNSINNDFVANWDDNVYIFNNHHIQNLSWNSVKAMFVTFHAGNYHPFTTMIYAIELDSFGLDAKSFHIINLIFHLLNILLVYKFIQLLTKRIDAGLIVALLFAIHPMHVESVSWISELKDVLYAFFFLSSLILYQLFLNKKYNYKYLVFAFLLFAASCFSKSMAVTLPVVLLLIDYFNSRKIDLKAILEKLPFFAVSIVFGIVAINAQRASGTIYDALPFSFFDRIFLVSYSIVFYIVKLFAPLNLCVVHFYPDSTGSLPIQYYASSAIILILIFGIIKSGSFRKNIIFGSLFFLVTVSLVIQIIPVGQFIVAERYSYIPYLGLFLIIGLLYSKIAEAKTIKLKKAKPFALTIIIIYSVIFAFGSYNRNKVWENGLTLFEDAIEKNPEQAIVYATHGNECLRVKDYKTAISDFSMAIKLMPNYADAYHNRGVSKYNMKDLTGAIEDYSMVIKLQPKNPNGYYSRGLARYEAKDQKGAIEDYDKVIELVGNYMEVFNNRGVSKGILEDYEGSILDFNKAIEVDPNNANAYFNRGNSELLLSKFDEACEDYKKAVNLGHKGAREMMESYCGKGVGEGESL
ncbi:MAG: tetratricopeptide repeat protein [Saprospiraceae bacterium]|nr:tetratricopeptide repeat protein [Saprospiraceae bacterium]